MFKSEKREKVKSNNKLQLLYEHKIIISYLDSLVNSF